MAPRPGLFSRFYVFSTADNCQGRKFPAPLAGSNRSLSVHPSHSCKVALDLTCKYICEELSERAGPICNAIVATALTHPQIFYHWHKSPTLRAFKKVVGVLNRKDIWSENDDTELVELQEYLRDPKRAGTCFVHGGTYATLSEQIFDYILQNL